MDNAYGLGFVLSLEDNASEGFKNMWSTFDETESKAEKMTNSVQSSFQKFESLTIAGLGMKQTGDTMLGVSDSILSKLKQASKEVIGVGDDFEQSRKTLEALYKSPDVARAKMDWAMDLASKTPFDINDVKSALIGLKSAGVDADKTFASTNGTMRTFLEYVGDLAGLRPDVGMQGVMMGVRNAIGGDGGKSLRARMDIDPASIIGHKLEGTSEQIMKDIVEMSQKSANNLMQKLDGTWTQLVSNLEDQKTRFLLAISDAGAFDAVKNSLTYISDAVESIDDTKLANLGKALSDAFSVVWKPVDLAVKAIVNLVMGIERLVETHPRIAKIVLVFLSLTGAVIGAVGIFFKLAGGIMIAVGSMGTFILMAKQMGMTTGIFAGLGGAIKSLVATILPLALVAGAVYVAWRSNFMGIRDIMQNFINNAYTAFSYSNQVAHMSFEQMAMEVGELEERFHNGDIFAGLTLGLIKVRVFWDALVDAWSDNTLSDENFKKAQLLGVLPLIEAILSLKANFEAFVRGFARGWNEANTAISNFMQKVSEVVGTISTKILEVLGIQDRFKEKFQSLKDVITFIKPDGWEKIGEVLGYITTIVLTAVVGFRLFKKVLALVAFPFLKLWEIGGKVFGIFSKVSGLLMTNPFALWTTVILAIIVALVILYQKSETFRNIVHAIGTAIFEVGRAIIAFIVETIGSIVIGIMGGITAIFTIISGIGIVLYTVILGIVGIVATVGSIIYGVIYSYIAGVILIFYSLGQILYGIFVTIGAAIATPFAVAFGVVATIFYTFLGVAQTVFAIFRAVVQTIVAIVVAIFTGDFSSLGAKLKEIWGSVGDRVREIWQNVMDKVKAVWSGVGSFLSTAWNTVKETWSKVMSNIADFANKTVSKVKSTWSGITGFFTGIWDGIKESAMSMFGWLGEKFEWLSNKISAIKESFSKVTSKISGTPTNAPAPSGPHRMVGLATGGYVKTAGVAMLHPDEVVVNDDTTQMLREFLISSRGGQQNYSSASTSVPNGMMVDNSVTFEKGSIVIEATGENVNEISDKFIDIVQQKLDRKQQLNRMMNYQPI